MEKLIFNLGFVIFLIPKIILADFGLDMIEHSSIFDQINNGFDAKLVFMHLHYVEDVLEARPKEPGNIKDIGIVYGININIKNVFWHNLYTEIGGEYLVGKVKYDGYDLNTRQLSSSRKENGLFNLDGKLGAVLLDFDSFQFIPYGGLGFRYWTPGSHNTYYNFKAIVGGKLHLAVTENFALSPYVNFGTTLGAHATAKNPDNTKKYKLGNKSIQEVGLEFDYRLAKEIFLISSISYTTFKYGKDDHGVVNGVEQGVEPNSKTNEIRFGIGIKFSFR